MQCSETHQSKVLPSIFFKASFSGSCNISLGSFLIASPFMLNSNSKPGEGLKVILDRKPPGRSWLALTISSMREEKALSVSYARSSPLNRSIMTNLVLGWIALHSLTTWCTSDDLPQRRGKIRMVLVPDTKLLTSRKASSLRLVKALPEAIFPKPVNQLFCNQQVCYKLNCKLPTCMIIIFWDVNC